jgi:hypothetical protein
MADLRCPRCESDLLPYSPTEELYCIKCGLTESFYKIIELWQTRCLKAENELQGIKIVNKNLEQNCLSNYSECIRLGEVVKMYENKTEKLQAELQGIRDRMTEENIENVIEKFNGEDADIKELCDKPWTEYRKNFAQAILILLNAKVKTTKGGE